MENKKLSKKQMLAISREVLNRNIKDQQHEVNKAFTDVAIYGKGIVEISDKGLKHVPPLVWDKNKGALV